MFVSHNPQCKVIDNSTERMQQEAASRLTMRLQAAGSKLTSLLPQHTRHWWPLVEDIFFADAVEALFRRLIQECVQHEEFSYMSIDATLKCCLSIMGQAPLRASKAERDAAAFANADSFRKAPLLRVRICFGFDKSIFIDTLSSVLVF